MTEFLGGEQWAAAVGALGDNPGKQRNQAPLGPASGPVCVTGASGFLALQLVTHLLEAGYTVVGTVRSESNAVKMAPLNALRSKFGEDKLKIISGVDLMKAETFEPAVKGCAGVFHTASPFTFSAENPLEDIVKPAKIGTEACLIACKKESSIKRVIVTSSWAAVCSFGKVTPDQKFTSKDWNMSSSPDTEGNFTSPAMGYCYSKTVAEKAAWDLAAAEDCLFDVACVNPPLIIGKNLNRPASEDDLNQSSAVVLNILRGKEPTKPGCDGWVDVLDVVRSHITVYERPEAGGRRWLCAADKTPTWTEAAAMLKEVRPDCSVQTDPPAEGAGLAWSLDNSGLKGLGVTFTPLLESYRMQSEALTEMGFLPKP